jgi:HK97 family phage major capsid protein
MPRPTENDNDISRSLIGQTFSRTFTVERGLVDVETRTVPLSFSSETPVERWYGFEILDHSPGAADLTRLNSQCPILVCHDRYDQVGVVVPGSGVIGKDKIGRAVCLFSQSERGQEIQTDVNDGVRGPTSFRYIVREMVLESSKDGVDTYRVTKWEVVEVSFESIAADITVGAGRNAEFEELRGLTPEQKRAALKKVAEREGFNLIIDPAISGQARTLETSTPASTETLERTSENTMTAPAITGTPAADNARTAEQIRRDEIIEIGELAGQRDLAVDLALDGRTVDEARVAILAARRGTQRSTTPAPEAPETSAARHGGELARVVSRVRVKNLENSQQAYRFGKFLQGVRGNRTAIQWCRDNGFSLERDLERTHSESDNESGGIFVPQEFSERLIVLRENHGQVRQYGYTETMTSNTKVVHRQKGGLRAYPAGAKGTSRKVATSQMSWDGIELIARKWKVTTKLEDELSDDSSISIADKFAGESAYAFALAEDDAFFNGDGTSTYHGVVGLRAALRKVSGTIGNIKGLVVATGNLFSEFTLADFIKVVAALPQYGDNPNTAWYCHRTFFWNTIVPLLIEAGGTTMKDIENAPTKMFLSYPVRINQTMPRTDANSQIPILLGDISLSSTFGDRLGQQVKQTDTNDDDWDNDLLSMKAIERFDVNHHDVGSTSEAGPVVGLISAAA